MNGATAEPCVNTINVPNKSRTTRMGNNQNFLRSFMKFHSSAINSPIGFSFKKMSLRTFELRADFTRSNDLDSSTAITPDQTLSEKRVTSPANTWHKNH